jgi:hypothetical protein
LVTEKVDSYRAGPGSSIALESTYPHIIPHISYHGNGNLKHAWLSNTTWLSETVDSVGSYTSLALDSHGQPHISYCDDTNCDLKYAWLSGTTWLSMTVDSEGTVGRWSTSLALDSSDNPHISYFDETNGHLKWARSNGTVWIIQTVDDEGNVGRWSSLALDQIDCPHISYADDTNLDLKYACIPTEVVAADFTAGPIGGASPLAVTFANTSTGDLTAYLWHFGDGMTSTLKNPTHTYRTAGAYTVTLRVRGVCGSDTMTKTDYIRVDYGVYLPIIFKNYQP